jgi:enamine deaminase RidA (YjgF/YER057c/UK114 family)
MKIQQSLTAYCHLAWQFMLSFFGTGAVTGSATPPSVLAMTFVVPSAKLRTKTDLPAADRSRNYSDVVCGVAPAARGPEISLTLTPVPGEGIMELFARLAAALKESDATIVHLTVFGSTGASAAGMEAMRRQLGKIDWPVTWIEGAACDGTPIAGVQVFGFAGGEVERIRLDGRVVGSVFSDGAARHCLLGGLGPVRNSITQADQTKETLDNLALALAQGGFTLADTVRTWFFLDDLLSWYDEFNRTRTKIYSGVKFRTGSLPASTGVGAKNPAGDALAVGAWAMQPLDSSARAEEIASPLQCPAPAYGSSFSRAMEIPSISGRRLLISGTASIAPGGKTLWPDDVRRQVALSMQVVEAILNSRGFKFSDLTRATAYFKRRDDAWAFTEWCVLNDLNLPAVVVQCDVCRDDLLFELEADAWSFQKHSAAIARLSTPLSANSSCR